MRQRKSSQKVWRFTLFKLWCSTNVSGADCVKSMVKGMCEKAIKNGG